MADKPKTPFIAASRTEGLLVGGVALVVTLLVGMLVGADKGWLAGIAAGALCATIRISWPLRKEPWFWIAMSALAAVNAFGVTYFDWSFTHSWSGHALASLMLPDIGVMVGIIYGLYRLKCGAPAEVVAEEPPRYGQRDIDL